MAGDPKPEVKYSPTGKPGIKYFAKLQATIKAMFKNFAPPGP